MTPVAFSRRPRRRGFSLIEVVLAIGLSVVLMGLIGGAISLYTNRLEASRSAVENGLLTRGLMRMIAEDLRNAAVRCEQDTSGVETLAASQASFDANEADQLPEAVTDALQSGANARRPIGVIGAANELQIDVARCRPLAPAIEYAGGEIQSPAASAGVTTVRYLVNEQGLIRQEANRDKALCDDKRGGGALLEESSRVVAPEVVALQFFYSDGEQTYEQWDTAQQNGALPRAVEVRLSLREKRPSANGIEDPEAEPRVRVHRLVVSMPVAPPTPSSNSTDQSGAGGQSGSTTGSSTR